MSYRQSYIRRGLSPESRLAMEAADEGSLDENLHSNVLRDSINYEGMVAPHRVSQQTPNANANPAPGNGAAVMRVRLQGRLDIYPDESDLTGQDSQYIRKDLDNFYNCGTDTRESMPTNPGEVIQMQSFGNDPSYDGSKNNLRFGGPAEIGAYNALYGAGLLAGGGNVPIANLNWNNSNISPSRPKKGKRFLSQGELTDDSQIPGAFIPASTRITSPYGPRTITIDGVRKQGFHRGIDFAGGKRISSGLHPKAVAVKPEHIEPCFSAFDGEVTRVSMIVPSTKGYGGVIYIKHTVTDKGGKERKIETRYGHVEYTELKKGDKVTKGQKVGHIGSQGGSTGPHLHFEIRESGKAIDPVLIFGWQFGPPPPQPPPPGEEEDDFPMEDLGEEGVS